MNNKLFFGWFVLAGLFLIYAATNGIGLNTLPLFYPQLVQEFKWDYEEVTRPSVLMYLLIAVISPITGFLLDRFKTTTLMFLGGFGIVGSLLFYSYIQSLQELTLVYVVFAVSLTLSGIVSSMFLITKWFNKYRGVAVGIFLMASSLGGSIFPPITGTLIKDYGWRNAIFYLACMAGVLVFLPLLFLIRNTPQEMGLMPDGVKEMSSIKTTIPQGISVWQALSSPTFYFLLFVTASMWFCITGVINNQTLYFKDLKIDVKISGIVLGIFFISSFVGKFIFGFLSDRFNKKSIMFLATVNLTIGTLFLFILRNDWTMYLYAIIYGIGFSGAFTMIQVMLAELYQGKSYGTILGLVTGIDTFAGSMGIRTLAVMREKTGSYFDSFQIMLIICILACVAVLLIKKPEKENG